MNFFDMFMHLMKDRKFIDDSGNVSCAADDLAKVFNDTVAILLDAEQGGCEGECDCHSEFENIGDEQQEEDVRPPNPPAPMPPNIKRG